MPRMTMQLPPHVDTVLQDLAREEQTSKVLVVRHALTLYARALKAVREEGYVLGRCTQDGALVREILLDL
jgi:hypothetical protein